MARQILIVDDDELLRRSLSFRIEQAGYQVTTAASAEEALARARAHPPDLVILDINLPGMDGLDALRYFREELHVPVVLLTARRRELDEALGLELGADDYVSKPYDLGVLLARIKAVLRRTTLNSQSVPSANVITVGDLQVDPAAHTVMVGNRPVDLTPREFDLLHALALEAGKVVSVDELLSRVWGAEFIGQPQVVYVHIRWLRNKIEADPDDPKRIITIRGVGYKLEPLEI